MLFRSSLIFEEAAHFYVSVFPNSKINETTRWGDTGPGKKGSVLTVTFTIEGQDFMALNGGPEYKFTPAISLMVSCRTQEEVDVLWNKLTSGGGQEVQCGWLTDKYGISWQVVPEILMRMIADKDQAKVDRAMKAMMPMKKLDIAALKAAFEGR